jgi:hypothetical protein
MPRLPRFEPLTLTRLARALGDPDRRALLVRLGQLATVVAALALGLWLVWGLRTASAPGGLPPGSADEPATATHPLPQGLSIEIGERYRGRSPEQWEALLTDPQPSRRAHAVTALAGLGGRSVPLCVWALDDGSPTVRIAALKALAGLGGVAGPAIPAMLDAARYDPFPEVRLHAINALGALGPSATGAAPALRELLASADPQTGRAVRTALYRITGRAQ